MTQGAMTQGAMTWYGSVLRSLRLERDLTIEGLARQATLLGTCITGKFLREVERGGNCRLSIYAAVLRALDHHFVLVGVDGPLPDAPSVQDGTVLLLARQRARRSRAWLANESGTCPKHISDIEHGVVIPRIDTMERLLEPLGLDLDVVEDPYAKPHKVLVQKQHDKPCVAALNRP